MCGGVVHEDHEMLFANRAGRRFQAAGLQLAILVCVVGPAQHALAQSDDIVAAPLGTTTTSSASISADQVDALGRPGEEGREARQALDYSMDTSIRQRYRRRLTPDLSETRGLRLRSAQSLTYQSRYSLELSGSGEFGSLRDEDPVSLEVGLAGGVTLVSDASLTIELGLSVGYSTDEVTPAAGEAWEAGIELRAQPHLATAGIGSFDLEARTEWLAGTAPHPFDLGWAGSGSLALIWTATDKSLRVAPRVGVGVNATEPELRARPDVRLYGGVQTTFNPGARMQLRIVFEVGGFATNGQGWDMSLSLAVPFTILVTEYCTRTGPEPCRRFAPTTAATAAPPGSAGGSEP